jgi:autotransporter-associated beta strand protein
MLVLLAWIAGPGANAATKTWLGSSEDDRWSTASNWSPSGRPQDGDALQFPGGGFSTDSDNDLTNLLVHSILFFGTGGGYSISGNPIRLQSNITATHSGSQNRVRCYVEFVDGGGYFATGGSGTLDVNGDVILSNNGQLALNCITAGITVSGSIFGNGSVIKYGDKSLTFAGNYPNDFSGTLTIQTGTNFLAKAAGVTAVPGPLILGQLDEFYFGQVVLQSPHQINDATTNLIYHGSIDLNGWDEALGPIHLYDGDIQTGTATLALLGQIRQRSWIYVRECNISGTLYLPADTTFRLDDDDGLRLSANITGPGGYIQTGVGNVWLTGINTFAGPVTIGGGSALVGNHQALGAGSQVTLSGNSGLQLWGNPIGSINKQLTINSSACWIDVIGGDWIWGGNIQLNFTGLMTCNGGQFSQDAFRIFGSIQGTGGIWFGGTVIEVFGNNTFTGTTRAACALLSVNNGNGRPFSDVLEIGGYFIRPSDLQGFPSTYDTNATAEVRWMSSQVTTHSNVTLQPNGFANLNGRSKQFNQLHLRGGRVATGAGRLYAGAVTGHPTNYTASIEGNLSPVSALLNFNIADGPVVPDLSVSASLSDLGGVAAVTKQGDGELLFSSANAYDGATTVEAGLLHIQNPSSLGTSGAGTTVSAGATLLVESVPTLAEPLNIRGFGRGGTQGALHLLTGTSVENLVLGAAAAVRVDSSFSILAGAVSGTGGLTKLGAGTLQLGGSSGPANTFTGDTIVDEGLLVLFKPPFVQAVPGNLVVGRPAGGTTAIARHFNHDQVWANITVNRGGLLDLAGSDEYPGDITLNNGGDIQTGTGTLFLGPGVNVYVAPGQNGASVISGRLRLSDGNTFSVGVQTFPIFNSPPPLEVTALIFDAPADNTFFKTGSGEMRLSGTNTFRANFVISAGRVTAAHSSALGRSSTQRFPFATYVNGSGQLVLDGGIAINDVLEFESTNALVLQSLNGSNYLGGPIALFLPTPVSVPGANGILQIANSVNGPGGITKLGPGTLQFWGAAANTYAGLTTVAEGIIEARRVNQISIPGDAIIGDDSTSTTSARIQIQREQQFPPTANVTIRRSGLLDLFPLAASPLPTPTLHSVLGSGPIQISTFGSSLTISNDASFGFAGAITGSGSLNKYGSGTMRLTGDSIMSGLTTIHGGTLRVDGIFNNSPITVRGGAAVSGDGVLGDVNALDGGPNLLQRSLVLADSEFPDRQGGDLEVGNLTMSFNFGEPVSWGTLGLDFFGPSPTGGNDRIVARGAVDIDAVRLSPRFAYAPREGDVLTLIEKQSAGAVIGTFSGLPQNALITSNGISARISYTGGNGNDITLTVTNLALSYVANAISSGNGNGTIEADECLLMHVFVQSRRATTLTITNAFLRSLTPGVEVTIAAAAYSQLAPNAATYSPVPFQFRTAPPYVCGSPVSFELEVGVTGEGIFALPFQIPGSPNCTVPGGGRCEACFAVTRSFTHNTPTTVRPLDFLGGPSLCFPAKQCPQTNFVNQAAVPYVAYAFGNTTTNELCVTAQLRSTCPDPLGVVAYLSPHNPLDPCANYLGDSGVPGTNAFSFKVPRGSNFVINVVARTTNTVCGSHTLEVFGLPCPPPRLQIAKDAAPGKVLLRWSTAYPGFSFQTAGALNVAGPNGFSSVTSSAAVVGGRYTVTNLTGQQKQFFRLVK